MGVDKGKREIINLLSQAEARSYETEAKLRQTQDLILEIKEEVAKLRKRKGKYG